MITLIGLMTPPINGQSVAFEILVDELTQRRIKHNVVEIPKPFNSFTGKIFAHIYYMLNSFVSIAKSKTLYIQITQSNLGLVRDIPLILMGFFFRTRVILHVHGGYYALLIDKLPFFISRLVWKILRKCFRIVVLSESIKITYPNFENIVVVENGIGKNIEYVKKELKDDIIVLYLSNMIVEKGYLDVLKGIEILNNCKENKQKIIGHFAGKFDNRLLEKEFLKAIKDKGLSQYVTFHDLVVNENKQELFRQSHFFLLPTYYINEGQPISIIEAMSYGCIPIVTNYRGIESLVDNNFNGFFVKPKSPNDIAEVILNVVKQNFFTEISHNNFEKYRKNFTERHHIIKLLRVLCIE